MIRGAIEKWKRHSLPARLSDIRYCQISYAMNGEDLIADSVFGPSYPVGRYIDVGCFEPRKWSNTYKFYLKGWRGLCIDPNQRFQADWQRLRPRDTFLNVAISTSSGEAIYLSKPGLPHENRIATGDAASETGWTRNAPVPTERLDNILAEYDAQAAPLDLMSIDCEGHDLSVLHSNDFERFRPRVLIVEDHSKSPPTEIDRFCDVVGYRLAGIALFSKVFVDIRWMTNRRKSEETE